MNVKKPIVYFGRLAESKGVELLIKAMYYISLEYPNHACPLWIIGGNYQEIQLTKEIDSIRKIRSFLESRNLLFWWGQLPHEILPFILRKCTMFCFTSKYEPGGRTILEAMASGLPVLASPQGIAKEVIKDGINGYIISKESPKIWAQKIYLLLSDEQKVKEMGRAAKKTIIENFTMNQFYDKHWGIYEMFYPNIQ